MSKPMYCPISFGNPELIKPVVCTPDCAWALKLAGNSYGCGIAAIAIRGTSEEVAMNARPLEDDDE